MELQPQPIYRTDGEILSKRLEFTYDSQGRRIEKRVYAYNAATQQHDTLESITRFIYDGWLLIAELTKPADEQLPGGESAGLPLRTYTNGLDLSGTTQGAGGIAGLLFMAHYNPTSHDREGVDAFTYDGNGNVTDLISLKPGDFNPRGSYEYSPFGQLIRATGTAVDTNPFQFSTKYTDVETGFCYYGYRYYDVVMGRWLNRDPVEENGGVNFQVFVLCDPIDKLDVLGLKAVEIPNWFARRLPSLLGHEWGDFDGTLRGFYPNSNPGGLLNVVDGEWVDETGVFIDVTGSGRVQRTIYFMSIGQYHEWKIMKVDYGYMRYGHNIDKKCKCLTIQDTKDCMLDYTTPGNQAKYCALGRNCRDRLEDAMSACCAKRGSKTHSPTKTNSPKNGPSGSPAS